MTEPAEGGGRTRGPSAAEAGTGHGPRVQAERRALRLTRLAWAAGLLVQGLNLAYETSVGGAAGTGWFLRPAALALGVLLIAVVVAHTARLQAYKRGWKGRAVTPPAYLRGNLLSLSALTLAACLLLGLAPSTGADRGIVRALALAATLATCLNWPNGKPMRPAGP